MKTLPQRLAFGFILLAFVTGFSTQYRADRRVVLPAGEVHDGWYFAAGGEVVIEGTVNGDVYAAGGIVEISGTVKGDVLAAGGQVTITGTVVEDIRVAGGTVRIDGSVGRGCTAAGGTVVVGKSADIKDNLLAAGGNVRVSGAVAREALITAGEMTLSGSVGGTLKFFGERLSVYEGANVGKDLQATVSDSEKVSVAAGTVRGTVKTNIRTDRPALTSPFRAIGIFGKIAYALMLMATAFVSVLVFPRHIRAAGSLLRTDAGKTALWGVIGLIAVPAAAIIMMITVIGIPLGLFVLVLYFWFLFLSQLSLPVLFGEFIGRGDKPRGWNLFWPIGVGVVVVQLLTAIPYLGFLAVLAGIILGLGALQILVSRALQATTKK